MESINLDDLLTQLPEDSPKNAKFRNKYEVRFEFTKKMTLLGIEYTRIMGINSYKDMLPNEAIVVELRKQYKSLIGEDEIKINSFARIVDDHNLIKDDDWKDNLVM